MLTRYIPKDIDVIIHSGDATNAMNPQMNFKEMWEFIDWYSKIDAEHKIYVAGNHDTSIYNKMITKKEFTDNGIIYLELESITINDVKFFGNPYTPTYGRWAFMLDRLEGIYTLIPKDADVLITHGPPKGILDLTYEYGNEIKRCGCRQLEEHIRNAEHNLKYVLFGHIHSFKDIDNSGLRILNDITYSNASVVTDQRFGNLSSYGNIIEINK